MAGAVFGEVVVSFFVAGAVFGEIWKDSRSAKCCIFEYKMLLMSVKSNPGCEAGCGLTVSLSDHSRIIPWYHRHLARRMGYGVVKVFASSQLFGVDLRVAKESRDVLNFGSQHLRPRMLCRCGLAAWGKGKANGGGSTGNRFWHAAGTKHERICSSS